MSGVLQRLRSRGRTRTKRTQSERLVKGLLSGHLKHRHQLYAAKLKRKIKFGHHRKISKHDKCEDDKRVAEFRHWCGRVGLDLHPNLYIGCHGSCHKIGVIAMEDISEGECLAVIPRRAILSCTNSVVHGLVKEDKELESITSSWVPLLIALAAEYSLKTSSYWYPYLSLVPNNESCGPPMLWSVSDRGRLLEGTGVDKLVEKDLERIEDDFTSTVLQFMKRNKKTFRTELQNYQVYKKLVSLVMSYSFTDGEDDRLTSSTMMVPFVDLLNHSSNHHAELTFHKKSLKLMVVRDIKKGEEVMNTYGSLSNATLLHTYGFCEVSNPHDTALVSADSVCDVYISCVSDEDTLTISKRQRQWQQIKSDDLLEDDYCVDSEGDPEQELLYLIKLLHSEKNRYEKLVAKLEEDNAEDICVEDLDEKELLFLRRLAVHCLSLFPESCDSLIGLADSLTVVRMTEKEKYGLYLSIGQQQCLKALLEKVGGAHEL